jgi:pantetheine-phosphate adenylyltransferase
MPPVAVYPGTFDPITLGHEDIARRACALFPRLVVAVARADHKSTRLPLEERLHWVRKVLAPLPQVQVLPLEGLLVNFCKQHGATVILRGLRNGLDFNYEMPLATTNRSLSAGVETLFLPCQGQWQHLSSTIVWEVARLGGDVSGMVSPPVAAALAKIHQHGPENYRRMH